MQNRSRHGFVEAVLRRPAVILAIAATCRKTERMENVGTIFYTAPVAPHVLINAFFLYSFLGWVMECIVIRREKGRWENRGFAHLPFCIIYGFGAMLGFALLRPFSGNYVLLYLVGAVLATLFEYLTARLMLRLFGTFFDLIGCSVCFGAGENTGLLRHSGIWAEALQSRSFFAS